VIERLTRGAIRRSASFVCGGGGSWILSASFKPTTPPAKPGGYHQRRNDRHSQCQLQRQPENSAGDQEEDRADDKQHKNYCDRGDCVHVQTSYFLLPTSYFLLPLFLVTRAHGCFDVAAHVEVAFEFDTERIARIHKIFEDDVDNVLVKDLHFTERVDIELQTL